MSHVATVKVKLKDLGVLAEVCRELRIPMRTGAHETKLYAGSVKAVASLTLRGWNFPVAVQLDGSVKFDNYGGAWGDMAELNRVLRLYSERVAVRQARRMGWTVRRQEQPDGSVVLRMMA